MAEQLNKQTLTRLAWITELRRQGHRQCRMEYAEDDGRNTHVCALGLLAEVAGIHPSEMYAMHGSDIGALAGMKLWHCQKIVAMNDGERIHGRRTKYRKHTFSEIADAIEAWFK